MEVCSVIYHTKSYTRNMSSSQAHNLEEMNLYSFTKTQKNSSHQHEAAEISHVLLNFSQKMANFIPHP